MPKSIALKRKFRRIFRKENTLYLLLLPSIIGLGVFYIVPFGISMYMMVIDNAVSRQFVGLENLITTWNNEAFRLATVNTIVFMGVSIPLNMLLALIMALALRPMRPSVRRILLVFFLLPLVIPSGSVISFWEAIVRINGVLNRTLYPITPFAINTPFEFLNREFLTNVPMDWLNSDSAILSATVPERIPLVGWRVPFFGGDTFIFGIPMVFIVNIFLWKNVGFNMILFQAGLDFIPKDYYEFAAIEGAGKFRQFRIVTLTYLGPTFLLVFILSVVNSFKVFREIYLLTGTHPNRSIYLLQHFLNNQFQALNYQRMASASFFTFGFIFVLVLVLYKLQQRQTYLS